MVHPAGLKPAALLIRSQNCADTLYPRVASKLISIGEAGLYTKIVIDGSEFSDTNLTFGGLFSPAANTVYWSSREILMIIQNLCIETSTRRQNVCERGNRLDLIEETFTIPAFYLAVAARWGDLLSEVLAFDNAKSTRIFRCLNRFER
jgi:hypothetical protein